MEKTERVELTVLCLIHKNGRYLLQDRVKAVSYTHLWLGHPLAGDTMYGEDQTVLPRQGLHCGFRR